MCPAYEMKPGILHALISDGCFVGIPELATAVASWQNSGWCMTVQQVRAEVWKKHICMQNAEKPVEIR